MATRAARIVAAVLVVLAFLHWFTQGSDFEVYWRSARRFLAGAPLYPASDGTKTYRYAPGILLPLVPLGWLPLKVALAAWYAGMVAAGWWIARTLARRMGGPRAGTFVLVGFLGVARPFLDEFSLAQANVFLLALVVASWVAEDRGQDAWAGALVALAASVKAAPALLLLDFLLRRRWRALAGAAACGVAVLLAPIVTYGPRGAVAVHEEWRRSLGTSAVGFVGSELNQGVFGLVALATQEAPDAPLPPGPPTWIAIALAVVVCVLALVPRVRDSRRALLLFAMASATPLGWLCNFLLAWPMMTGLAATGRRLRWAVGVFGVLLLIPIYDVTGPAIEDWVFAHGLPGLGLLAFFGVAWALRDRLAWNGPAGGEPA
ncbi:MAG TPA: glycosyltransferase family 87 protein [Anaeromyxobacteraceae bacterium]|nr:glycosyltransferase family 87 protein [Anaeromyxobacteraceae bacterium]